MAAADKAQAVRLTRTAELVEESIGETLTFDGFPDSQRIKLRTNKPLVRIVKKIQDNG